MNEICTLTDSQGPFEVVIWPAPSPVRAVLHILHGMAEHAERYAEFAQTVTSRGITVYAHNHPGHGPLAKNSLGHFGDQHGWQQVIQRVAYVRTWIRNQHTDPACCHFVLGHSMGSFVALAYLSAHAEPLTGLWLSASTLPSLAAVGGGRIAARFECARQGIHGKSWLLETLSFSSFNREFKPARTSFDWLSRDPHAVDQYRADPLCGFRCTNQLGADFLGGLWALFAKGGLSSLPREIPILLFSGTKDPVGGAKGVPLLADALKKAGVSCLQTKLFIDCRHELLQETNRAEVAAYLTAHLETSLFEHREARDSGRAKERL